MIDQIHENTKATIVIIEHRLEDVLHRNVDRIIVINDGVIQSDTTPDELLASQVLKEVGIREPLYITALKYAGCSIDPNNSPSCIQNIRLEADQKKIQDWFISRRKPAANSRTDAVLTLDHVFFSYDNQRETLKDISFTVRKGEMLSIVGKNGAGKSTLSKLICGFEVPSKGRILYQNEDMQKYSIKMRAEKIGMVM